VITIDPSKGVAQGHWQRSIWECLANGHEEHNPLQYLKGNAKSYAQRYAESLEHMFRRAMKRRWIITKQLGPRGGSWSATYSARLAAIGALVVRDHEGKLLKVVHADQLPEHGLYVVIVNNLGKEESYG
jgi:hypothetical protein